MLLHFTDGRASPLHDGPASRDAEHAGVAGAARAAADTRARAQGHLLRARRPPAALQRDYLEAYGETSFSCQGHSNIVCVTRYCL